MTLPFPSAMINARAAFHQKLDLLQIALPCRVIQARMAMEPISVVGNIICINV